MTEHVMIRRALCCYKVLCQTVVLVRVIYEIVKKHLVMKFGWCGREMAGGSDR